jgi:hypothetical protein
MRLTLLGFAVAAAALASAMRPSEARAWYPWCATYFDQSAITECAFTTFQQCLATVSGIGGTCGANPWPPPVAPRRYKRHRY